MALEIDGKVVRVLAVQSGESQNGTWKKQQFVLETLGEYPKKICFQTWGDKTEIVSNLQDGDRLKVSFRLESREYNEKWYTDAVAWRIDKLVTNNTQAQAPTQQAESVTNTEPPLPEEKEADDLPF